MSGHKDRHLAHNTFKCIFLKGICLYLLSNLDLTVKNTTDDLAAEFQLDERIIHKAIQKLKSEKCDGDKGLCSNLVSNAPTSWGLVLKSLIECMIVHGHYARELLLSTLCWLPQNKLGDVCNSDNNRGIALTSCINKVLDWVILLKYANNLKTSNLQFAYK